MNKQQAVDAGFLDDMRNIILEARSSAVCSVEYMRMIMYWHLGERIFVEEQCEQDRAEYGSSLIKRIAGHLEMEFGSGFSIRQLELCRQFYRTYPKIDEIHPRLNWTQYRMLIRMDDGCKREYYELEASNNAWTGRELERQINSLLYERLLMSNDKEAVLAVARKERIPEKPNEIIKNPMCLEFLGLKREAEYYEKDIESEIINHLQEFLLELGNGFSFVARQKRILLEDDEFFADLIFYNRLLHCFVVVEIKTNKLTHADLGQLQMYVNYYDRYEKLPNENPMVGILLCTSKNDLLARITLPEDNTSILTSEYRLYLPSENDLIEEIKEVISLSDNTEETQ
ncbi:MAG: PDDEXK nuclease domain-containing protein [Methanimicrococcus sp.]|nr:PDDEXK nuclease domain-containing protein [Methanimicrococcus sp.]